MAFLQVMKRVTQERRLLDAAFYEPANLEQLFAASAVSFGRPIAGYRLYGTVSGFGVLVEAVRIGGTAREGMTLAFSLSAPPAGPPEGRLLLTFLQPSVAFDDIEKVFGKEWEPAAYPARADGSAPYATRAHGSSAIRYRLGEAEPAGWMAFAFNARALLESASASVR